jgi:hypothetical protein
MPLWSALVVRLLTLIGGPECHIEIAHPHVELCPQIPARGISKAAASSTARTQPPANLPTHRLSPASASLPVAGPRHRVATRPST